MGEINIRNHGMRCGETANAHFINIILIQFLDKLKKVVANEAVKMIVVIHLFAN